MLLDFAPGTGGSREGYILEVSDENGVLDVQNSAAIFIKLLDFQKISVFLCIVDPKY